MDDGRWNIDDEVQIGIMARGMWSSVRERMLLGCISAVIDAAARALSYWPGGDSIVQMVCCQNGHVVRDCSILKSNAKKGTWLLQPFGTRTGE